MSHEHSRILDRAALVRESRSRPRDGTTPIAALVAAGAYFAAQQSVPPQHRTIKGTGRPGAHGAHVPLRHGLLGVSVRSPVCLSERDFHRQLEQRAHDHHSHDLGRARDDFGASADRARATPVDLAIGAFLLAHVVALFNVSDPAILTQCVVVLWRQLAACAFFYCIFMFVNDEERLFRFGKVVSIACTLVMLTAVTELFFPGAKSFRAGSGSPTRWARA